MTKNLLIVESPAKAKTINKYLGKQFQVLATYGHVRDLIPKSGAIDVDNDFAMHYDLIEKNTKHVNDIAKAMKKADALYLATDQDREGEAISWHLYELLAERKLVKDKPIHRVVFNEITPKAIQHAIEHPRELSTSLINAQQARRALDYLVGFNLSPLLWKKVKRGLSAGRVQSPALRMIVEREKEIEKFVKREYWSIEADVTKSVHRFLAKLTHYENEKLSQFSIANEKQASAAKEVLLNATQGKLVVTSIKAKQRKRHPAPPFITSTLQQEAARKLGFSTKKTMRVAQQLYEGVAIHGEMIGLITYMRTDSVSLAQDAIIEIRKTIKGLFGEQSLPDSANYYKTKTKNAQEAHEAIRPSNPALAPDKIASSLDGDQARLYKLIWQRTLACQMIHAIIDTVSVDLAPINNQAHTFHASGSTVAKPGFLVLYEEGKDNQVKSDESNKQLPKLTEGEVLDLKDINCNQHFTEPPPRYSEATLVKALEEHGIGRPSTYASIISTLLAREYAELISKRFHPTDVGKVVSNFLSNHFDTYVDYQFTAHLEDELDAVSRGEADWVPLMKGFWDKFHHQVAEKEQTVTREEASSSREIGHDPKTGKPLFVKLGRYGSYVQIGSKDDEEKPKFAGLRPGQKMDTITLEEALSLFDLPRELGVTEEGEPVSANIGRFGPYVKYGSKYVSIKDEDPYTIELAKALELIKQKKEEDANKTIKHFKAENISVLRGRYGPYITDGKINAKLPKGQEPEELTLEQCQEILANAPKSTKRTKSRSTKKKK